MAKVICSRCGGYGGEPGDSFGDCGWHPCFHCGTEGYCSCPECLDAERAAEEAEEAAQEIAIAAARASMPAPTSIICILCGLPDETCTCIPF